MTSIWFWIATVTLTTYVVLDGFDFGAGALHLLVARTDRERRQVLAAIGPFWDGNEVWLLALGGVLFLAFPKVLASALSGFYLGVILLIWTLILRGIAIEFRSHVQDAMWRSFWDGVFFIASAFAPVLLGATLGNLIRGVPIDAEGYFALPLFRSFSPHAGLGIIDWYTLLLGLFALAALAHHGALFLAWKTEGPVRSRSLRIARRSFPIVLGGWVVANVATWLAVPAHAQALAARPLYGLFALLALLGLLYSAHARAKRRELPAFIGSCVFVAGMLLGTAGALFPNMLRAAPDPSRSLGALNSAADPHSLEVALRWWPVALVLVIGYMSLLFRLHRGKAAAAQEGEGY